MINILYDLCERSHVIYLFLGIPFGKVSLERVFIFCFVEPFKHIIVVSEVLATILGFRCMVIKMLRIYFSSRFSEKLKGKDTLWVHHTPSFENLSVLLARTREHAPLMRRQLFTVIQFLNHRKNTDVTIFPINMSMLFFRSSLKYS